jgi:hypothetical protein
MCSMDCAAGSDWDTTSCKAAKVLATSVVCKCYNASTILGGGAPSNSTRRRLTKG